MTQKEKIGVRLNAEQRDLAYQKLDQIQTRMPLQFQNVQYNVGNTNMICSLRSANLQVAQLKPFRWLELEDRFLSLERKLLAPNIRPAR